MKKKNVIVMGKGTLAGKVADWFRDSAEYEILCVVPNMPESSWTLSLKDWAERNKRSYISTGKVADIPGVKSDDWRVDLAISVTYDKIIRQWFIDKCDKIINIHNGPLPRYRGVNPVNWALKNDEREHGVTIHEITPGIDDGPIVSQAIFPVNPAVDEVVDVYERSLHFGWKLFKETMPKLWTIDAKRQDESKAEYFSAEDFSRLEERSYFTRAESISKLGLRQEATA
jgi:methionyl-tRNA formyltransferase